MLSKVYHEVLDERRPRVHHSNVYMDIICQKLTGALLISMHQLDIDYLNPNVDCLIHLELENTNGRLLNHHL